MRINRGLLCWVLAALYHLPLCGAYTLDYNVEFTEDNKNIFKVIPDADDSGFGKFLSAQDMPSAPRVGRGDKLTAVDGVKLANVSLKSALAKAKVGSVFALPLVNQDTGDNTHGYDISAFVRIEILDPATYTFTPLSKERMAEVTAMKKEEHKRMEEQDRRQRGIEEQKRRLEDEENRKREDAARKAEEIRRAAEQAAAIEAEKIELQKQAIRAARDAEEMARLDAVTEAQLRATQEKARINRVEADRRAMEAAQKKIRDDADNARATEAKRKAEEEQRAKQIKEAEKAERARRIALNLEFDYEVKFAVEGPMGIEMDINSKTAVISKLTPGGSALRSGLMQAGDMMLSVNGKPTESLSPQQALQALITADWPKVLMFRRPEKEVEELPSEEDVRVAERAKPTFNIVYPTFLKGSYPMNTAEWGGASPPPCVPMAMVQMDPLHGCDRVVAPNPEHEGVILMAFRGACTFVHKVENLQASGAAVALVVNNDEHGAVGELPAGTLPTEHITSYPVIIERSFGERMWDVMRAGPGQKQLVAGWVGSHRECSETELHYGVELPQESIIDLRQPDRLGEPRDEGDKGGVMWVWRHDKTYKFSFTSAGFGAPLKDIPYRLVGSFPRDGCDAKSITVDARGAILLVRRGGCSFTDKAMVAVKRGAAAVVVINSDESILKMPSAPGLPEIVVQAAMIGSVALNIFEMGDENEGVMYGLLREEDTY